MWKFDHGLTTFLFKVLVAFDLRRAGGWGQGLAVPILCPSLYFLQFSADARAATLRLNFYSNVRYRVPIDPTKHYFDSKFEIKTTVH
jgi:hypothetical protein